MAAVAHLGIRFAALLVAEFLAYLAYRRRYTFLFKEGSGAPSR